MADAENLVIEIGQAEDIPFMSFIPVEKPSNPMVFYVPGYHRTKTDALSLGFQLAQKGIACISFDPLYHGSRFDARLEQVPNGIYPTESGMDIFFQFLQIIRQCSLDIGALLRYFAADARVDTSRAGVTGVSMGAYASFLAFAEIPTLKCAVPMMGIPTFAKRWMDLLDECAWSNPEWEAALKPVEPKTRVYTTVIQSFDPAEKLYQAAPRALLAMNGDFDSDQPKHYTLDWYRKAREVYADHKGRLKWNIYPVGHTVTAKMEQDAVEWFGRYLVG